MGLHRHVVLQNQTLLVSSFASLPCPLYSFLSICFKIPTFACVVHPNSPSYYYVVFFIFLISWRAVAVPSLQNPSFFYRKVASEATQSQLLIGLSSSSDVNDAISKISCIKVVILFHLSSCILHSLSIDLVHFRTSLFALSALPYAHGHRGVVKCTVPSILYNSRKRSVLK